MCEASPSVYRSWSHTPQARQTVAECEPRRARWLRRPLTMVGGLRGRSHHLVEQARSLARRGRCGDGSVGDDDGGEGRDSAALPGRGVAALDPSGIGSKRQGGVGLRGVDGWDPARGAVALSAAAVVGGARRDLHADSSPTSRAAPSPVAWVALRPRSRGRSPVTAVGYGTEPRRRTGLPGGGHGDRSRRSSSCIESWPCSWPINSGSAGLPSRSRLGFAVSIPRTRSCRCHTKRSTRRCSCSRGAR